VKAKDGWRIQGGADGNHGDDVYGTLKFESGVHRVQRVPILKRAEEFTLLQPP
jgi:hypothetical protein